MKKPIKALIIILSCLILLKSDTPNRAPGSFEPINQVPGTEGTPFGSLLVNTKSDGDTVTAVVFLVRSNDGITVDQGTSHGGNLTLSVPDGYMDYECVAHYQGQTSSVTMHIDNPSWYSQIQFNSGP